MFLKNSLKWLRPRLARNFCSKIEGVFTRENIRNIGIIAHVDHGKTTLVDCILKEAGLGVESERVMDKNELEKEKGITILAKVTGLQYQDKYINIVDTPGHQDFGGEVERVMNMIDGVCLVICACEGPMQQTKYVLKKAIQSNVKPIVVINKVDREAARVQEVENEIFELFIELDSEEKFMNYPVFYASAKNGWAVSKKEDIHNKEKRQSVGIILDEIIKEIPCPHVENNEGTFKMLVSQIDHHKYFGRMLRGKILSGGVKVGDELFSYNQEKQLVESFKVSKIYKPYQMDNVEIPEAKSGDIVGLTGMDKSRINHTLSNKDEKIVIPAVKVDPPTLMVEVTASMSPQAGKEGVKSSFNDLVDVFKKEEDQDISLRCTFTTNSIIVEGRGDLHIGVLLERLRRNGYEFEVSCPMVITKTENGKVLDPLELVTIELEDKYINQMVERIMSRGGTVLDITYNEGLGKQVIRCEMFSKGLIGFRVEINNMTSNSSTYKSEVIRYEQCTADLERQPKGAIISTADGKTTAYGLRDLEKLGPLFVKNGQQVYEGMVIGESSKDQDWDVNPVKLKELTNIRTHEKDEKIRLMPPREFNIEEAITYIREDELVDVSPTGIKMRKKVRSRDERRVLKRKEKKST